MQSMYAQAWRGGGGATLPHSVSHMSLKDRCCCIFVGETFVRIFVSERHWLCHSPAPLLLRARVTRCPGDLVHAGESTRGDTAAFLGLSKHLCTGCLKEPTEAARCTNSEHESAGPGWLALGPHNRPVVDADLRRLYWSRCWLPKRLGVFYRRWEQCRGPQSTRARVLLQGSRHGVLRIYGSW
jgi:hypothetical protein